ncbi:Man1-Src1p-C-terminal domain-containing protein [Abortiporus biennis]|nr:Man1-Src1p-C-terminal domain-containing protein [Abortiporus biennis]
MSSRMTSAQIIAMGDYLNPEFDPATLTVSQLLGVFGFHNINYPSQYTKPKLVQLFNDEIKSRANKFKRERLKRENSQASDDGITDGLTGRPLNENKQPPPLRRSSRRSSRAPSHDPQTVPKRRRSSAEPSLGGPSRRRTVKPTEPVVIEESEPEEIPVRKVGKKKTSADAGTQARRVSQAQAVGSDDRDSGWEDNNIFQTGSPSPSPVAPRRTRRSSAAPPTRRKSMSAPPEYALSSAPSKGKEREKPPSSSKVRPPESTFEPELPPGIADDSKIMTRKRMSVPRELPQERKVVIVPDSVSEEEEPAEVIKIEEVVAEVIEEPVLSSQALEEVSPDTELQEQYEQYEEDEELTSASGDIQELIESEGQAVQIAPSSGSSPWTIRLILLLIALSSYLAIDYKQESVKIGFCDVGKTTNQVIESRKAQLAAIESCNRENRTLLYAPPNPHTTDSVLSPETTPIASVSSDGSDEHSQIVKSEQELCPPLPLFPFLIPQSCTPCPSHATCTPSTVTCENGYLIKPNPILFFLDLPPPSNSNSPNTYTLPWHPGSVTSTPNTISQFAYKAISLALDGLPYLGPVALPPRCVEDPKRKRHIGVLGKAVESMLASERGRRLCAGVGVGEPVGSEVEEAKKWGVDIDTLKENIRRKTAPHLMSTFEDTFNEAIQQLVQWGGVFLGEDADGKRYLAHRTPHMDLGCSIKVKARESWQMWRNEVFALATLMISISAFRRRRTQLSIENKRVSTLIPVALDYLRNQELAHHTDPITTPQAYLSSLQLRDLILQDEHSVSTRTRIWEQVERIVEANANVRTNLEEVESGDEMRVWRWVGSAGKTLAPGLRDRDTPPGPVGIQSSEEVEKV